MILAGLEFAVLKDDLASDSQVLGHHQSQWEKTMINPQLRTNLVVHDSNL